MTAADLIDRLRARGVTLIPAGDRLRYRPASALTADEVEALRQHKAEILQSLSGPPRRLPALDPQTVREELGEHPDPHVAAAIAWDVLDTVRALEREIATGVITPGLRLVAGRPLADWLQLDDIAGLLRAWRDRRPA